MAEEKQPNHEEQDRDESAEMAEQAAGKGTPSESSKSTPIVGIGASAGGLKALQRLFRHMPDDTGVAFVVVVHLSPEHESRLADLLQPHCAMSVLQVTETVAMQPNQVYLIPPGANLNAIDTHLRLSDLEERRQDRATIDHFFRTLADTHDGDAIGLVLTGTGSDGTLGLRRIKEAGGLTIAQDPEEAEYDGMVRSAIAAGTVDLVRSLEEMPAEIVRHARSQSRVRLPGDGQQLSDNEKRLLQKIFAQLRARTGQDFSQYKQSTILRRLKRRMQLQHADSLAQYLDRLRESGDEAQALFDDMLITVTEFFRDRTVYEKLRETVIPELFAGKSSEERIRVWSVGCSTGEEAYSLAMLLLDESSRQDARPEVQVFATDLHPRVVQSAREGIYPRAIAEDIPEPLLRRFFVKQNGSYRIGREVRETVVFAEHNLLRDPPFSHLDLIVCRNLLIYLQRDVQEDVAALFHYALKPDGLLLLGSSETVGRGGLFRCEDKKICLFRKRNVPAPESRLVAFPLVKPPLDRPAGERRLPGLSESREAPVSYGGLHERMVERYAPPSVLVNDQHEVVHASVNAGRFLRVPGGEPTRNIFKLIREPLQIELQAVLHAARSSDDLARSQPVLLDLDGQTRRVVLQVHPCRERDLEGFFLLLFDEHGRASHAAAEPPGEETRHAATTRELEADLELHRQRLQAALEEYETGREEMQATNEELQSANEELRSTMEELETSKEELQSMNEELVTVNQENRHRVEELGQLSADLQNLLAATDIATLFLDRELRIVRFTPRASELFNVRHSDRGRPLSELKHHLGYAKLHEDAREVLERLIPVENEVQSEAGAWYLTRILPYRGSEDRIQGVVLTLVDITERKRVELELRRSEQQIAAELEAANQLHDLSTRLFGGDEGELRVMEQMLDVAMALTHADCASMQKLEVRGAEAPNDQVLRLIAHRGFTSEAAAAWKLICHDRFTACGHLLSKAERVVIEDVEQSDLIADEGLREFQRCGIRAVQSTPLISRKGRLLGVMSTHWRRPHIPSERELESFDIAARQAADAIEYAEALEALRAAKEYAESIVETLHEPLLVLSSDLTVLSANSSFLEHFQVVPEETLGRPLYQLGNGQWDIPALRELLEQVLPENDTFNDFEVRHDFEDLGERVMLVNGRRLDHVQLILLGIRDITEKKRDEQTLQENEQRYRELSESLEQQVLERTAELRERERRLSALALELAKAEEQERKRLARVLHDQVQQLLVAAKLRAGMVLDEVADSTREQLEGLLAMLNEAQDELRSLAVELSPPVLHERGLAAGLEWLANRMHDQHRLRVTLELDRVDEPRLEPLRDLLFQSARELLLNVVKHAGTDSARIRLFQEDYNICLQVSDAGSGFDSAAAEQDVEDSFGLFNVGERLRHIGGGMTIESVPGEGTRVKLTVPVLESMAGPDDEASAESRRKRSAAPDSLIGILLVDDHQTVRDGLAQVLSREPRFQIVGQAGSGEEAVRLARELHPRVVVMDVNLPSMTGIEATRQIKSASPAIQVVGLSLHVEDDLAQAMLDAGAARYLNKQCATSELRQAILDVVE